VSALPLVSALRSLSVYIAIMGNSTKPVQKEHFEDVDLKGQEEALQDGEEIDINDVVQNKKLNRRLDMRVLPLCCWVYLLNFLDRGELITPEVRRSNVSDCCQVILVMRACLTLRRTMICFRSLA
jgi:hypothetical protein